MDGLRVLVDEMNSIGGILNLWKNPHLPLLSVANPNISPCTWCHMVAHEMAVGLFGRNFFGLRTIDAVMGALSVVVTYLLVRTLFDRRVSVRADLYEKCSDSARKTICAVQWGCQIVHIREISP